MAAGDELRALGHGVQAVPQALAEELRGHLRGLGAEHDLRAGMALTDLGQRGGMVGLHVVDHDVVKRPTAQRGVEVFKEHAADGLVHRVHQNRLFVQKQVAVIAHTPGDGEDVFKQVQPAVVCAHPEKIGGDLCDTIHDESSFACVPGHGYEAIIPRNARF